MSLWQIIGLSAGTLVIAWFTWHVSLKSKRYHGIWRFFSFESILAMVLLAVPTWFHDPFCIRQIFSWICLAMSLLLFLYSFYLLNAVGKPKGDMENTTVVITKGLYRFIRHPMYSSLIWGGVGLFLKHVSIVTAVLLLVNLVAMVGTARVEEQEMIERFGDQYRQYMRSTARFIPFVF